MSRDYFAIVGVLLAVYGVIRFFIWTELRLDTRPLPPSKPYDGIVKSIDAKALSDRVQDVRRDYSMERRAKSDSFKQSLRIRSRQEEIARLAFFQKPPSEPPEHEHGWNTLLV